MFNYGWGGMMAGWPFFGIGWIVSILFWFIVIFVVVKLITKSSGEGKNGHSEPLEILKQRYAKGEIDKKQFEEMKKDLI